MTRPLRRSRCCTCICSLRGPQDTPPITRPLQEPLLQLGLQLPLNYGRHSDHREIRRLQCAVPWLQGDPVARPAILSTAIRFLRGRAGLGKVVHGVK